MPYRRAGRSEDRTPGGTGRGRPPKVPSRAARALKTRQQVRLVTSRVISAVADSEGGVMLSVAACNSRPPTEATVAREDAEAVIVEADADDSSSDDCADGAVICLDTPLGDRDLIDRSTGKTVSVEVWQGVGGLLRVEAAPAPTYRPNRSGAARAGDDVHVDRATDQRFVPMRATSSSTVVLDRGPSPMNKRPVRAPRGRPAE